MLKAYPESRVNASEVKMVEYLRVEGGARVEGEIAVDTAKNATLPILAACVMIREPVTLEEVPDIADVAAMLAILESIGCKVTRSGSNVTIDASAGLSGIIPAKLTELLRSSLFLAGPMLVRNGSVALGKPGGCVIGNRKVDLHTYGLGMLGASCKEEDDQTIYAAQTLRGAEITLVKPSVGATENIMMAATLAQGITVINGAAREPEIVDLARFLNACGAKIAGAGKRSITIRGVSKLRGVTYKPIGDRIIAGTLIAAAAITGGEVCLTNAPIEDMRSQLEKFRDMGCVIRESGRSRLTTIGPRRLKAFAKLTTKPYPGFPTDMQAIMLALASVANGATQIEETVFDADRFAHVEEMRRLGANVIVNGRTASVTGVRKLRGGQTVYACDLRAGAALVVASLSIEGITRVDGVEIIDRGYPCIENMLGSLGAKITRVLY